MAVAKGLDQCKAFRTAHPETTRPGSKGKANPATFTIGAIPRSGKSHTALGFAHEYCQLLQGDPYWAGLARAPRILVFTSQPSETGATWTQGLSSYREFDTLQDKNSTDDSSISDSVVDKAWLAKDPSSSQDLATANRNAQFQPARWVIMSKQAFDTGAASRTHKAAAAASDDQNSPAADEVVDPSGTAQNCKTTSADRKLFRQPLKVIAADPATLSCWQLQGDRPTLDQVIVDGFDVILFDEAHFGSTSSLSKAAIERLMAGGHTLLVLISGTYTRPVLGYMVPKDHLLTWSLMDVSFARSANLKGLADVHGLQYLSRALQYCDIIASDQVLNSQLDNLGLSPEQLSAFQASYASVPQLNLCRLDINWQEIRDLVPGVEEGNLSFKTLLQRMPADAAGSNGNGGQDDSCNDAGQDDCGSDPEDDAAAGLEVCESDASVFKYPGAVRLVINKLLTGLQRTFPDQPITQPGAGSVPGGPKGNFHTVLVFLHYGDRGSRITPTCEAFREQCQASVAHMGKDYAYLILPPLAGCLPENIKDAVKAAWAAGKDGLILLTGSRGGVGLDVPEIDAVWMLTDAQSSDYWMQRAFRCLTERSGSDDQMGLRVVQEGVLEMLGVRGLRGVMEMMVARTMHNFTPVGLCDNLISKLVAAQPDIFKVPSSADVYDVLDTAAPQQQHQTAAATPMAHSSRPSADEGTTAAAHQMRSFLDFGAGTGIMAAAIYDRLLLAGWDAKVVQTQMLYVAEPDMAMQYLLAVAFPSFRPGGISSSSSSGQQGLRPSLPCNLHGEPITAVKAVVGSGNKDVSQGSRNQEIAQDFQARKAPEAAQPVRQLGMDLIAPQLHQPQFQFDVIVGYPPHTTPECKKNEIASHKLACAVPGMLKAGGHALLLLHNRWRTAKGGEHKQTRQIFTPYLAEVWDVVIQSPGRPSLLRWTVAKNGGEQLVHLAKQEQQQLDELRRKLGYKHVHSDRALGLMEGSLSGIASTSGAVASTQQIARSYLEKFDAVVQTGKHVYVSEATATAQAPLPTQYTVVTTRSADRCVPWGTAAGLNTGQMPNQRTGYLEILNHGELFAGKLVGWQFNSMEEASNFKAYLQSPLVNSSLACRSLTAKLRTWH
eukprot:gene6042-6280_t